MIIKSNSLPCSPNLLNSIGVYIIENLKLSLISSQETSHEFKNIFESKVYKTNILHNSIKI
ncbi:unnamed protein product [Paramecium octaurelia]|uniref:Uncharacterized protein n=1 Tax=Paramecium octaurelia TaxID=43137 RepID=A0A8S1SXI1_PAROT|nr:unnamed protein product [Paramecium octaurelia]